MTSFLTPFIKVVPPKFGLYASSLELGDQMSPLTTKYLSKDFMTDLS